MLLIPNYEPHQLEQKKNIFMLHVIIVLVVLMNCSSSNSNCYMLFILYSMNVSYVKCFVSVITCFVITNIFDFYVNTLFCRSILC